MRPGVERRKGVQLSSTSWLNPFKWKVPSLRLPRHLRSVFILFHRTFHRCVCSYIWLSRSIVKRRIILHTYPHVFCILVLDRILTDISTYNREIILLTRPGRLALISHKRGNNEYEM